MNRVLFFAAIAFLRIASWAQSPLNHSPQEEFQPSVVLSEKKSCELSVGPRNNLEKLGVFMADDQADLFDSDVLMHLEDYFRNAHMPGPFVLHSIKGSSPERIQLDHHNGATHLYFYENAMEGLALVEARKAAENAEKSIYDWQSHTVTVEAALSANNSLVSRLNHLLLDKNNVRARLEGQLGIKIEDGNDPMSRWSREELLTLNKIFMDMPAKTVESITQSLRSIKKYPILLSSKNKGDLAAAKYNFSTGELMVSPETFVFNENQRVGDHSGERVLMHELGHAFWHGMKGQVLPDGRDFQEAFKEFSWTKDEKIKRLEPNTTAPTKETKEVEPSPKPGVKSSREAILNHLAEFRESHTSKTSSANKKAWETSYPPYNSYLPYNNFVSDYSSTNAAEDFAESFASFMYNSKDFDRAGEAEANEHNSLLGKKKFMKEHVFDGTSFFYTVHENMRTYLYNENSDTEPPLWSGEISKLRCTGLVQSRISGPGGLSFFPVREMGVSLNLDGITENGSGLEEIRVRFDSVLADGSLGAENCFASSRSKDFTCTNKESGNYSFGMKIDLPLQKENYVPTSVTLIDKNGNERTQHVSLGQVEPISLPASPSNEINSRHSSFHSMKVFGDSYTNHAKFQMLNKLGFSPQATAEAALGFSIDEVKISEGVPRLEKMNFGEEISGNTYEITIPKNLSQMAVVPGLVLSFKGKHEERSSDGITYIVKPDAIKEADFSEGKTTLQLWMPDVYAATAPDLSSINFEFSARMLAAGLASHSLRMEAGRDKQAPSIDTTKIKKSAEHVQLREDQIKFELLDAETEDARIAFSIPLTGSLRERYESTDLVEYRSAVVRDPNGKTHHCNAKVEKDNNGQWTMNFEHNLKSANFLSGDYEIIELSSKEILDGLPDLKDSGIVSRPFDVDSFGFEKSYLERNFTKKIRITRDAEGPRVKP